MDYRLPDNRLAYFEKLYELNLEKRIMPGLVYLYMPELAERFDWSSEDRLWFCFLNGMTQNPITSLQILEQLPECPRAGEPLTAFREWFDRNWDNLQFDTDRRYQKKATPDAIASYADQMAHYGFSKQTDMWRRDLSYEELWARASSIESFGRLSSFSFLEYVYLNNHGTDCDDLMFEDKSGSRSHRNGMLLLLGQDELVWDKRMPNGHTGEYSEFKQMCGWLTKRADLFLEHFSFHHNNTPNIGRFTLESNLCTFKNHFFGRRYPGVYADMAWERIQRADDRGLQRFTKVFKQIREERLPYWLRAECESKPLSLTEKAKVFPQTGTPYRGEYFL